MLTQLCIGFVLYGHPGLGSQSAGSCRCDCDLALRRPEVNLSIVVIKGTQVYDSSKGNFVDLSVLDVLQVFGRAGRPGFESSGEGYICTTEDKLAHYLDAVMSQVCSSFPFRNHINVNTEQNPIESQFVQLLHLHRPSLTTHRFQRGMIDSLNAEISLGTVASVNDGIRWLGYTYLFVRMRKNPFIYGLCIPFKPAKSYWRHQASLGMRHLMTLSWEPSVQSLSSQLHESWPTLE